MRERTTFTVDLLPEEWERALKERVDAWLTALARRGLEPVEAVELALLDRDWSSPSWEHQVRLEVEVRPVPSPYDAERRWPIMGLNDDPKTWGCRDRCAYGTCGGGRCGGCCGCLGGCPVEDVERPGGAPYVWEGDQG